MDPAPALVAASLLLVALAAPALAQPTVVEEVLCPITTPENPVKYCITITGRGCLIVDIGTFGLPEPIGFHRKVCPLP